MSDSVRAPWLLALGEAQAPPSVTVEGRGQLALAQVYKHDFFAHTARYGEGADAVLVKRARRRHAFLIPLGWLGQLVTWHERRVYRRLEGLAGVPRLLASPSSGVLVHEHLPGRALAWGDRVPDGFLEELEELVERIHARGVAVVDLEKPGNVLLGDDHRPALFDFQLAWYWPRALGGGLPPLSWIRGWMQQGDRYHLGKLRRRLRPDTMTEAEIVASRRRPGPVHLVTKAVDPFRRARRAFLRRKSRDGRQHAPGEHGRISR